MVVTRTSERLSVLLSTSTEVWIATALISEEGLTNIQSWISPLAVQHYLVGIDMGTPPAVLKLLLTKTSSTKVQARIAYPGQGIFHPKLYLIKKDGMLSALVGSCNLTKAGLFENVELQVEIVDQEHCQQLLSWFNEQYSHGYQLSEENIHAYEREYEPGAIDSGGSRRKLAFKKTLPDIEPLSHIDFSDRFFDRTDHLAFRKELWLDTSPVANRERYKARERFLELHELIYPRFDDYKLADLYPNIANHIVSNYYHTEDRIRQKLDAMWLSYGKSQEEVQNYHRQFPTLERRWTDRENDYQSFMNHARIQVRIELEEIGIWILFGKNNNGSLFDRGHFRNQMEFPAYRQRFFNELQALPSPYWISINGDHKDVSVFSDPSKLHSFCKKDHPNTYFIIGRDYKITDPEMSKDKLPKTTLLEFQRLMPLYKMMRHYFT